MEFDFAPPASSLSECCRLALAFLVNLGLYFTSAGLDAELEFCRQWFQSMMLTVVEEEILPTMDTPSRGDAYHQTLRS
eukprot:scaffold111745_cov18-Prasinocladus_malaysianus.AAC.1